jgi:hypothetical protein
MESPSSIVLSEISPQYSKLPPVAASQIPKPLTVNAEPKVFSNSMSALGPAKLLPEVVAKVIGGRSLAPAPVAV